MSEIDGIGAPDWIRENHPENDLFKVYWKNIVGDHNGGVTFDPEEGEGLRYEWYYKDNKKPNNLRLFCYNCYFILSVIKHRPTDSKIPRTFEEAQEEITGDILAKELGESLTDLFDNK